MVTQSGGVYWPAVRCVRWRSVCTRGALLCVHARCTAVCARAHRLVTQAVCAVGGTAQTCTLLNYRPAPCSTIALLASSGRNVPPQPACLVLCIESCASAPPPPLPTHHRSYGDVKSADPSLFLGVYQLYFFFPALVIARLWGDAPFERRLSGAASLGLWAFGSVTFAVFFSYVAKWLAIHMVGELPAVVLRALEGAKQLP